jgi:tRNA nucleotidyltransferase (CCA-adding enzyme)
MKWNSSIIAVQKKRQSSSHRSKQFPLQPTELLSSGRYALIPNKSPNLPRSQLYPQVSKTRKPISRYYTNMGIQILRREVVFRLRSGIIGR